MARSLPDTKIACEIRNRGSTVFADLIHAIKRKVQRYSARLVAKTPKSVPKCENNSAPKHGSGKSK